jgi:UDP-N-acetylglucosamine acyltransferase
MGANKKRQYFNDDFERDENQENNNLGLTTPEQNKEDHKELHFISEDERDVICREGMINYVHPTAIIGENVKLGKNNKIGAYCIIEGNTVIGDNNTFVSHSSIGTEPEHKLFFGKPNKGLIIGNNNMFREFTTVNAGCEIPTELKDNIIMLRGSHVGHDSIIMNDCVISCNVLIGGHSILGIGVNMGLGSICHQFSKIGSYAMIGMGCIITKKNIIECFGVYVGNPAKWIRRNTFHSEKFTEEGINNVFNEFVKLTTKS